MADDEKKEQESATITFFKEQTVAMKDLRHAIFTWIKAFSGSPDVPGPFDRIDALTATVESLDNHLVGLNYMLSRISFVFDKMLEVRQGKPEEDPPAEPREVTLKDVSEALIEFDKTIEEPEDEEEEPIEEEEIKPPMLTNMPEGSTLKKNLPPLPVMPSKPE